MKYLLTIILAAVALSSCSSIQPIKSVAEPEPAYGDIKGLVIVNNCSSDINLLEMRVPETGTVVRASRVIGGRTFSTEFPSRTYRGNPVDLYWKQDGFNRSAKYLLFTLPRSLYKDNAVTAYLVIDPGYRVRAEVR